MCSTSSSLKPVLLSQGQNSELIVGGVYIFKQDCNSALLHLSRLYAKLKWML